MLDASCTPLVETLCGKSAAIKAAVASPAMLAAMATPETVGVALKLIETYGIEISDEVRELAFCCNAPPGTSHTRSHTPSLRRPPQSPSMICAR